MRYLPLLVLIMVLSVSCGEEDESGVFHFTNSDVQLFFNDALARDPAWSPDMKTIVFTYLEDLYSIPPEGGEAARVTSLKGSELSPNWSPVSGAGKLVFINTTGTDDFTIYTLTPGGGEPQEVKSFTSQVSSTSWSNDGEKIVFLQLGKKGIFTIPEEGGEVVAIPNDEGWEVVELAQASPARDYVIYTDRKGTTYRINEIKIEGGAPRTIISFSGGAEHPTSIAESYDGLQVAYTTPYPVWYIENLFIVPATGGKMLQITNFRTQYLRDPNWASDGKRLVVRMSEGLYLVKLKT